ncbi:hypothetical protein [Bradyrhizobium zhanjiangense]|uniref:Uncharacterized protein n=1 Tax=Bradyrhizobium zhanjiangense TaxID=1325107 RepID=A0ABY0DNF9_9BRAD|nr:hypothetical protein [Bradyrhizobium zhanjiangense]RXG96338.1 hypothetical protein EAS62_12130 [Bradyrhizobium zhanjiangense]
MLIQRVARDRAVNRLDPEYLAQWLAYYCNIVERYVAGAMSWSDAQNALLSLGYRDQALKIELLELDKARAGNGMADDRHRCTAVTTGIRHLTRARWQSALPLI